MKFLKSVFCFSLFAASALSVLAQQKGYYRFPAINGSTVVFTAEGDLWKYNLDSGTAVRLTTGLGVEWDASISHDGKWIAFIGQYEGPSEVYVIPAAGGVPERLTFEEGNPAIHQWTADGKILYSTTVYSTLPGPQIFRLDPVSGKSEQLPLEQADQGTFSPSGELFFTRLRAQGSHTKRYKGGTAQTIWKFDGRSEAVPLTSDFPGTNKNPMHFNNRIYFLTDRDGTMNIWSMSTTGSDLKQHTKEVRWDLSEPDITGERIICKQGADLVIYNITTGILEKPEIILTSDFVQKQKRWITDPKPLITSVNLSHAGDQVVITARGRVFSVPVEGFRWSEVTRKYGIRYKNAAYAGEGNEIRMLSDESGEYEIWSSDNYGFQPPVKITGGSGNMIVGFKTSPDGKYIVFNEKDNRLMLYSSVTRSSVQINSDRNTIMQPFAWSYNSRWVAYTTADYNQIRYINVYDIKTGSTFRITSGRLESFSPAFSRDNKWLYFISERSLSTSVSSPWGSRQPEPYYEKTRKIYAVALDKTVTFPFLEANELGKLKTDTAKPAPQKTGKKPAAPAKAPVSEDFDAGALESGLFVVPMKAADIGSFDLNAGWLYWTEYNQAEQVNSLYALKITNARNNEPVTVASSVNSFTLSGDGKKILVRDRNGIMVFNADGSKPDPKKNTVDLAKWAFTIDPAEDWRQMYRDAWRMERDYFYDRDMHGVDWNEVFTHYEPLLGRITDRHELDDVLAQMISELSALHMTVSGGDKRTSQISMQNGFLGARLSRDESSGGYRISQIYRSDPDFPAALSPLAQPGSKILEGDVIVAINGVNTLDVGNINELLINKGDVQVRLKLRDRSGSIYEEIVKPVNGSAMSALRYNSWEYSRRLRVDSVSKGRIGYIHLKAMGSGDYDDFVKGFYPSLGREGLIIDVRHNRGGNIDSWVLEKLMRKAWFFWAPRVGFQYPNMQMAFTGHMVVLIDQNTASDGEAFAEGFRRLGLGKLIGTRTWGGEIWLSSSNRLVDNGIATAAETGVYSTEGEWLIEGWGVEPDIVVDNLPFETFRGRDRQLEAAVEHLVKLMKESPVKIPPVPKYPDKSFDYK